MTLADKLTASRLVLAPIFFIAYRLGEALGPMPYVVILWVLFLCIEFSDVLDGLAARRSGTVSDFGKLFDPYADVFARITYFVCFVLNGFMPAWVFIIILYREFSINFLRMLLAQRGIAMGARPGGKLKSATYMAAGAACLILLTLDRLNLFIEYRGAFSLAIYVLYVLAAILALVSFMDYLSQYRKLTAPRP
jgi:CDP-diacylglycerol---glycerol-3-phosphate 3-phosphatidyltransferase